MKPQQFLEHIVANKTFDYAQMTAFMQAIVDETFNPLQIAALLACLQLRGETAIEITAASQFLRNCATPCPIDNVLDIAGTGGDKSHTFNISTAAAIVAAAAGARVAKHGGRAVSSQSGSADVLQTAGVPLDLTATQVAQCVNTLGIGFLFAPQFHAVMKTVKPIRQGLGIRTLFNLIAPLCNPTRPQRLLLGISSQSLLNTLAEVSLQLGYKRAMIVHADDGFDEISAFAPTQVVELNDGAIQHYTINPADHLVISGQLSDIQVDNAQQSLDIINAVFANQPGPARNMIVLNAGAAICIAGLTTSLAAGITKAQQVIETGLAKQKFADFVQFSQSWETTS